LDCDQIILPDRQAIMLNASASDRAAVAARGVAHLDLGHVTTEGRLGDDEFRQAEWLARVRMDSPDGWPARELAEIDGPATV
jgi:hypothetical protein